MEWIQSVNSRVNQIVWGPYMLLLLLATGVFFTVKLRFFQLIHFRTWWKLTIGAVLRERKKTGHQAGISPFRAVSAALAGSVGTGNIVGVANAIALGGPGAVFWMWIAAFFGMGTIYAENVLGVRYRVLRNGKFVGGPMYYIEQGLHCKWLAVIFALCCTLAAFGMGNMTQGNSVAGAVRTAFGIPETVTGIILVGLVGSIIVGGIDRISGFTERLMPIMTVIYLIGVCIVLTAHIKGIPGAFLCILEGAFDMHSAAGGLLGYGMTRAIKYGISRGVFSNEAGLGSSPIVHAAAETEDPCRQGMWGIFQVFVDTILLCTLMALCILSTGADSSKLDGIELSVIPFKSVLGSAGKWFIVISIILFSFGTLISWAYYGEKSLEYLTGGKYIRLYRLIYSVITFPGCVMGLSVVWELSDTFNGLMAIPNLIALIFLSGKVVHPIHQCNRIDK